MLPDEASVSVVIAVYNGERYLAEAIESVLAQTEPVSEIIVVDDGSSDRSAAIAEAFGPTVRCFPKMHEGVSAALNFGIARARGNLLAFLDADDLWLPPKIARQRAVLMRSDAPDLVFGYAEPFLSPELALTAPESEGAAAVNPAAPGLLKGTMLLARCTFQRVGDFDTTRHLGDFIDWYLRAQEVGLSSVVLPDILLRRRIHDTNTVTREKHRQTDYVKILKASLERRRGNRVAPGD